MTELPMYDGFLFFFNSNFRLGSVLVLLFGRLPVSALQENFQSLLGLLKESVQLNLAPPGHFLLLRYCVREKVYRCVE